MLCAGVERLKVNLRITARVCGLAKDLIGPEVRVPATAENWVLWKSSAATSGELSDAAKHRQCWRRVARLLRLIVRAFHEVLIRLCFPRPNSVHYYKQTAQLLHPGLGVFPY